MDVHSMSFKDCRNIYPIRCIRPLNNYKYDDKFSLKSVLSKINAANCTITDAIFDNPKRSLARCALSHSSLFACEYCENSATSYIDPKLKITCDNRVKRLLSQKDNICRKIACLDNDDRDTKALLNEILNDLTQKCTDEKKR